MNSLTDFTDKFQDIPKDNIELFLNLASEKKYKKNEIITSVGEISKDFYIIKSGIVRSFFIDKKGKEFTRYLSTSNKTTGSLSSLLSKQPNKLTYECLTDCVVYKLNFEKFKKLTKQDILISNLYSNMMENIFLFMELRIQNLAVLNATERYLKLKEDIPDIDNLIPQYHIASYLNVSAVQLSRIRKELYSK